MKIGINVMSLIGTMAADYEGTVDRLKVAGCDYFEAMSDWGAKPETIAFFANLTGPSGWDPENTVKRLSYMQTRGMHIEGMFVFDDIIIDQAEQLGLYAREHGIRYVVFSFLEYRDLDDIYGKIQLLKTLHEILCNYGVKVYMHNHEHDLARVTDKDGTEKPIMDIFLENLTAEEMMIEADTGWLLYAGIDPTEYVKKYMDRIAIIHLKDICTEYRQVERDEIFVACGDGAIDFPAIFREIKAAGREDMRYVIDQDSSKGNILEDLIRGISYLKKMDL